MLELDSNTSAAWLASTVRRKLNPSALEQIDISATTRRVLNHRQLQGLRVEGHLMYGVARLIAEKAGYLSSQTALTRQNLEKEIEFGLGGATAAAQEPSSPEMISQTQTLEMISSDFNLDRIVDEFRPTQSQDYNDDFEMPYDDELRGDDNEQFGEPDDQLRDEANDSFEGPNVLGEGDEQVLRNILGQESQQLPTSPVLGALDMDDVNMEEAQEAVTSEFEYEPGETTEITAAQDRPKQKRATRKRMCPVDDQINIARNTRAPASILRNRNGTQSQIDNDDGDDFFDPARIAEIIKRRRLAGAPEQGEEVPEELPELAYSDPADVSVAGVSMDGLMDMQDEAPYEAYDDGAAPDNEFDDDNAAIGATQLIGSLAEDETLEELMAQEIRAARQSIKQVEQSNFSDLKAPTKRGRAALFSEMLALATQGELKISQAEPYAEISLRAIQRN